MVQKYQSPVRVYKYPFELVMAAYEKRFPTCKMIPVFLGSDIINEEKSEDESIHVVERRCKLNVEAPYLLKKIVGVDYVYFIQKNSLDRQNRSLKIEANNESFSNRIIIIETCIYSVHPENPEWTCFEQSASLDIKSFYGFESTVEKLAMRQYSLNIQKGKEIIEYYINELLSEGITYIPPFGSDEKKSEKCDEKLIVSKCETLRLGASASNIVHDANFKLDTEYIHRCLGDLTPLQESQLLQLRSWVAELQKGKIPSDTTLLRFLRARDFNIEKAREMLSESLVWRKKHRVDKILSEYETPEVVKKHFPGGWHHRDKDDMPVYILRLGQMDVKGLIKSIGEEGLLKLTLHICEEGIKRTDEFTREFGKPISNWTLLVDLEGLNMRHLWRPGVKTLLRIIEIVEANYPDTLGRVLIIRAPRVFPILWTIVGTFIDDTTRSKFLFYGGNDYREPGGLIDYINEEYIPDFLGGPCKCEVYEGGLVPKSQYMTEEELNKEQLNLCEETIYHSISLAKGQVHEVIIHIEDKGSVVCWDFDVMKQDVTFSVIYTHHPVLQKDPVSLPSGPIQAIQQMNPLAADPDHKSVIEKTWKEGTDYFKVEKSILCHDGESIQGTHVTDKNGYYILQWKFADTHVHHSARDIIDDIITIHKAKVMYYYDTLAAEEYRGSMSSLLSTQSCFSSLSSNTNSSRQSATSSCPSR